MSYTGTPAGPLPTSQQYIKNRLDHLERMMHGLIYRLDAQEKKIEEKTEDNTYDMAISVILAKLEANLERRIAAINVTMSTLGNSHLEMLRNINDKLDMILEDRKADCSSDGPCNPNWWHLKEYLDQPIFNSVGECLCDELSTRTFNCLINPENGEISFKDLYIGDLVQRSEAEMLKRSNFGRKSLNEIKEDLQNIHPDLRFGMDIEGWEGPNDH